MVKGKMDKFFIGLMFCLSSVGFGVSTRRFYYFNLLFPQSYLILAVLLQNLSTSQADLPGKSDYIHFQ
tara:strand:+ start:3709 stop:3912 length:204 start_codon:yes stop_codon:yes gene_type:complete